MRTTIELQKAILTYNFDYSGWTKMTQQENNDQFFIHDIKDKTYFTAASEDYVEDRPFEVRMVMDKSAHKFKSTVYSITDLLIEIGGISRALIVGGIIATGFAAKYFYRAALVQDLFMEQE